MQGNVNIPDSTITSALTFRNLVLMNMQQLTNFPYIENDFDALTDYELLSLVVKYLNDVIANQNEQNDSITRMYESFLALQTYVNNTKDTLEDAFNELDDYVRNYFDNLDVQEEINNKLDQMLEDGVLEGIIQSFLQTNALWCFDTVADMKLATNFINGSSTRTLGYYEINDGGASSYKIRTKTNEDVVDEMTIIAVYDTTLVAELVTNDEINARQFGAYGDNTHDDTLALQTCLNFSFDNRLNVYIPDGTYLFSALTFPTASFGDNEFAITIKGNSRQSTILKHTGTGIAINVSPRGESYCNGINMFNFNVSGNENTTIGINLPRGTRIKIDSVNVNLCNICVKNNNNFWLSSLTNMFLGPTGTNSIGLEINGSSVTSIYYDEIYVNGSSKYAYHIEGTYSHIGILAADNCTGDYVYYFNYCSSGSVGTIASENANVTNIVKLRHSSLVIDNVTAYNPNTETIQSVLNCESCKPSILTISVSSSSEATIQKPLATLSFCNLTIDSISGNLHFNQATSTNNNDGVIVYNSLKIRGSSRPYIGNDRSVNTATTPYNSSNLGVAIFTDCTTSPSLGSDGTSYNWKTPAKQGDWFIENKPGEKNVAAYVLLEDGGTSQGINDAKRAPIPLILSGNTASRPTSYIKGGVYYDTTLGKPIWYTGSGWVDATGKSV